MDRMRPADFQFRSSAETLIKDMHRQGTQFISFTRLAEIVGADTVRRTEVLEALLEDLIEIPRYIARVDQQTVFFHQPKDAR